MGVGTTATLSTVPAMSVIWSSSNFAVASVHTTTGVITAHKTGTVTISASFMYSTGETCTQSCQIRVLADADVLSETYYINYQELDCYVFPAGDSILGNHLRVRGKTGSTLQRWLITKVGDEYLIKSLYNNMYLGIAPNNIAIPTLYTAVSDLTKWKIYKDGGACVIAPYLDEYSQGRVLSPSSNQPMDYGYVGLLDFFDTRINKYWYLKCVSTYLLNHYDYSINNNQELLSSILFANQFVQKYFSDVLGHNISMVGSMPFYADLTINQCTCGENNACTNSTDCYSHHKNFNRFCNEISLLPKSREQKLIMWSNHPSSGFFCYKKNGIHTPKPAIALADTEPGGTRIRIYNYAVELEWDPYVSAPCILAHEIAHVFGVPEQYTLDPSGHSNSGDMVCMMQRFGYDRAKEFYAYLRSNHDANIVDAFCDKCWEILVDNVEIS